MNLFQDDQGNYSSMRVLVFFMLGFLVFLYFDWRHALYLEVAREVPNYDGITHLFNAMIAGFIAFIIGILAKVFQKVIENKTKKNEDKG